MEIKLKQIQILQLFFFFYKSYSHNWFVSPFEWLKWIFLCLLSLGVKQIKLATHLVATFLVIGAKQWTLRNQYKECYIYVLHWSLKTFGLKSKYIYFDFNCNWQITELTLLRLYTNLKWKYWNSWYSTCMHAYIIQTSSTRTYRNTC